MHYHLEIIMPPTSDIEAAVEQIMKPFCEGADDEDGVRNTNTFWDFYVIGGRYSGRKLDFMIDPEKKKEFYAELTRRNITVSSIVFGKEELHPASQIPEVDALWNEFFPDAPVKVCPFFKHFNDQYKNSAGFPDITTIKDMPKGLTAHRCIIASGSYKDDGSLEAQSMREADYWNGVSWNKSAWDGKVQTVIEERREYLKDAKPDYAAKHIPGDDWLVITVDYHC